MQPTAKSLILDLLASLRGQPMPVRALVAAAEVFGISPESLRVALARLRGHGTIASDQRGEYRLAGAAQAVHAHVVAWTHIEERLVPWRGGWIGVHTGALSGGDRSAARRRARALELIGLRLLAPHLHVRPDNLRAGIDGVRADLHSLGLEPAALVFAIAELDASAAAQARALWDGGALVRGYRRTTAQLARSRARLDGLPLRDAMVESFVLGGQAIRQLALDPLLPEPIVAGGERAALVAALRDYDRAGRGIWRTFMRGHGAPHLQTPRTAVAAQWPALAAGDPT